jgi:hypothetical protein
MKQEHEQDKEHEAAKVTQTKRQLDAPCPHCMRAGGYQDAPFRRRRAALLAECRRVKQLRYGLRGASGFTSGPKYRSETSGSVLLVFSKVTPF